MKNFLRGITKREILFGVSGLIVGVFLSLAIFSALVPSGLEMIRLYKSEKSRIEKANSNR